MVETAGKSILFDPFISPNPLASAVDTGSIMPDYMLISHGHGDHVADALPIAKQSGCTLAGVFELTSWFHSKGIEKTHGMNIGGSHQFSFGNLKLTQAIHSSTLPDGTPGGVPAGFVVENQNDCFYYSGDTALFSDMALIGRNRNFKTCFLPVGDNFTMGVEDALEAALLLGTKHVIGMHFDTFEVIRIDHDRARETFARESIKLELMSIGSSIQL